MHPRRTFSILACVVIFLTPCFAHHLAVVVNKDNHIGEVSSVHLARIFQLETKKWPDGKDIVVVMHRASSGENLTLERLNKMSGAQLKAVISAHPGSFLLVDSDSDLLSTVQSTPGAIGRLKSIPSTIA